MHVHFLGTSGALPTPNRNPACIMIRRGQDTLLFDCGEGAQQQMMRAKTGFTVDAVFITHWHADHYLGLLGLVQTMSFMGRKEPLYVYGPRWVSEFIRSVISISRNNLDFEILPVVLSHGSVVPFKGYTVRAFTTDHGIPSLGYILCEDERPGRFDREKAVSLGVNPGPLFGKLQKGNPVSIERDGEIVEVLPSDVMGPDRPGRKVVYSGDTRPRYGEWMEWAIGCDLLIHDATFDNSEQARAREVYHSTAGDAGRIADELSAQRLALVHISSRYIQTANHIEDAGEYFKGYIFAPDDLTMTELPFREE